jgi:hypothetical protein
MARANRFDQLIGEWEPRLQRAFLDSIYALRDAAHIDQIVRMLENGDVGGALRAVGIDPVAFRPFDRSIAAAFEAGGNATAAIVPAAVDDAGFRSVFQFSVRNPEAEAWLRMHSGGLIKDIAADQLAAVRNFLSARLAEGANPRTTALDLVGRISATTGRREAGVIGLTSSQEEWVRNYAAELASDNPQQALTRNLRDKRFDRAVMKAANEGKPIPPMIREKMVRAYRNRALRYRAETIARKETITALHTAQEQAMQQAIEAGAVDQTALTYVWRTAHDERVRASHRPMDGQVRRAGMPFTTGAGASLLYPGDPQGPASEVIACRCFREPRIDFLAGIR